MKPSNAEHRRSMVAIRGLLLSLFCAHSLFAQSSAVQWSSFNTGFAGATESNMVVKSVVGQNFVGAARQSNTQVLSGFLNETIFHSILDAVREQQGLPQGYRLTQNYPNPFNPATTVRYEIPVRSAVTLRIYNVLGQPVATLVEGVEEPGFKSVEWNALPVGSGVYFGRLEAVSTSDPSKHFSQVKKMMVIK